MAGTILCAVDDSEGAGRAVDVAARLCERLDMRLLVVHVVDDEPLSPAARREARRRGERLVAEVMDEHDIFNADWRVSIGTPSTEIHGMAAEEAPEMIILGSRLRGPRWRPPLRGRLVSELAPSSPCPVLVVPAELRSFAPAHTTAL